MYGAVWHGMPAFAGLVWLRDADELPWQIAAVVEANGFDGLPIAMIWGDASYAACQGDPAQGCMPFVPLTRLDQPALGNE